MRLVRFQDSSGIHLGIVHEPQITALSRVLPELVNRLAPGDMAGLFALGSSALQMIGALDAQALAAASQPLAEVRLLAPIINPPKIICCWSNYAHPTAPRLSETPIFFSKYASAIIGPDDQIQLPRIASDIVVEPELTAVIGTKGRHIAAVDALNHVAGYTIVNDVTAFSHRLQILIGSRGPYTMAKTFDTFAPLGPWIVTRDEVPDPHALAVRQWLNDALQISSTTAKALVKLPEMISYVSDFFTLQPGDLIVTGSPPPLTAAKYLSPGDRVKIEIEGIGVLHNTVVAEPV